MSPLGAHVLACTSAPPLRGREGIVCEEGGAVRVSTLAAEGLCVSEEGPRSLSPRRLKGARCPRAVSRSPLPRGYSEQCKHTRATRAS